jgi:hypothetical protein
MKLELNPERVAEMIVAEADRKGNGLSQEHEQQLGGFIVNLLSTYEVKKPEKHEKESK